MASGESLGTLFVRKLVRNHVHLPGSRDSLLHLRCLRRYGEVQLRDSTADCEILIAISADGARA